MAPKISVILPVYNVAPYLERCFLSLTNQTMRELEFIFIDDCSTDDSLNILKRYEIKDSRVKVIALDRNLGAAVARNKGLDVANGEYISFVDPDDMVDLNYYETLYAKAIETSADIIKCQRKTIYDDGSYIIGSNEGIRRNGIYNFCGEWQTAIYKHALLKENNIRFRDDIRKSQDVVFLNNVILVTNTIETIDGLYYNYYKRKDSLNAQTIPLSSIKMACFAVKTILDDVNVLLFGKVKNEEYAQYYLSQMYAFFNLVFQNNTYEAKLECVNNLIKAFHNCKDKDMINKLFIYPWMIEYLKFKKASKLTKILIYYNYNNRLELSDSPPTFFKKIFFKKEHLQQKRTDIYLFNKKIISKQRRLIVSLTSYPKRIHTVHIAIQSILNQTIKADKIILWLSEEQFPNKEKDLPKELLSLLSDNFVIDWCEDIKSYKKIIPTLKKYPNEIIITFDDDIIYTEDCIENLYTTWLKYPNYVIANRAHYILYDKNQMLPYNKWQQCSTYQTPTHSLLVTAGAGALFFPNCFYKDILKDKLFLKLSKNTDDLWLWAMLVLNNTKIKKAYKNIKYDVIPNTQECGLWETHNRDGGNDTNLKLLFEHYPEIEKKLKKDNDLYKNKIQEIFSIKNSKDKNFKIITIFYIKIKIKKEKIKKIFSVYNKEMNNGKWHRVFNIFGIKLSFRNKTKEAKMEMLKKYLKLESQHKEFAKQLSDMEQKYTLKIQKIASQNKELNKKLLDSEQQYILQIQKLELQNKELNQKLLETEKKHISQITEQNDKFTKQLSDIEQKQILHTKEQIAEIKKLDNKIEIFKDQKRKSPHKFPIKLKENEKDKMIQYISKSKQYLEFGSGGSTFLAKLVSSANIISIEADKSWLEYIKEWDILDTPNINLQYVDIGKTKEWSYPIDETKKKSWSDYSKKVFENENARKSDLVLIDGRFRVACALQTILNCDDDVTIMIHDFWNREHYHILLDYLEVIDRIETLAIFKKKKNIKLNEVKKLYEKYKNITL